MEYNTLTVEGNGVPSLNQSQSQSLYAIYQQIEDKRAARGRQYDLAGVIIVLILAKLAGMNSLLAASDWG